MMKILDIRLIESNTKRKTPMELQYFIHIKVTIKQCYAPTKSIHMYYTRREHQKLDRPHHDRQKV